MGALVATFFFEVAKNLFLWYTESFSRYELVYGSVGAVIGLLTWIYLSSAILLFGAEMASEYGRFRLEPRTRNRKRYQHRSRE